MGEMAREHFDFAECWEYLGKTMQIVEARRITWRMHLVGVRRGVACSVWWIERQRATPASESGGCFPVQ